MRLCLDQPSVWNCETSSSPCCVWVYRISMSCWTLPLRALACVGVCPTAIRWHLSCFHVCFGVLRVHSSCFIEVIVMTASLFLGTLFSFRWTLHLSLPEKLLVLFASQNSIVFVFLLCLLKCSCSAFCCCSALTLCGVNGKSQKAAFLNRNAVCGRHSCPFTSL